MKKGVDISVYQKNVNYDEAVKHIDFAILRVGYGINYMPDSQRDKAFDIHYNGFKGKIPLGAYYFSYASNYQEGRAEAENCLKYIGDKKFELPIYYDVEISNNNKNNVQGFIDRMREVGIKVGIYASSSFYKDKGLASIKCDSVWIAQYGVNNGNVPSREPTIPYDIWQYTSVGSVQGIGNRIDMDLAKDVEIEEPQQHFYGYTDFIKELQVAIGAKVDGIVGKETRSKLPTLSKNINRTSPAVRVVQKYLYKLGYTSVGDADGIAGAKFDKAVKEYQMNNGLTPDGIIGKNTWNKLLGG